MIISSHAQRRAATSAKSLIPSSNVTSISLGRLSAAEIAKSQWPRATISQLDGVVATSSQSDLFTAGLPHIASSQITQHTGPRFTQKSPSASARTTHPLDARHFMLQCRHRRLSESTCYPPDRRRYSTAAAIADPRAEVDNPSQLSHDASSGQNSSQSLGNNHYLQLVLLDEPSGSTSRSYTSIYSEKEETQPGQGRVMRLSGTIDPIKALTAALKADRNLRNQQPSMAESTLIGSTPNRVSVAWDEIMKKLKMRTPVQRPSHEVATISGNEGDILELYYVLNLNPLYELVIEYPILQFRIGRIIIQGPEHGVKKALEYIKSKAIDVVVKRGRPHTTSEMARRVRFMAPARRVADVPRPTTWTRRSLAQYVEALTLTRPPVVLRGKSHSEEVATEEALSIIMELLQAPEVRPFLSWTVFRMAMFFIMGQRKTNEAWSFLALMEELGFHPYAPFYNPMLLASAQDQLPDSFNGVLDTMHNQRVRPDAGTWIALLVGNMTVGFKQEVMRSMADRGLSARSPSDQELAPVMIAFSFPNFLNTGGGVMDYIAILDDIWGPNWLSDDAVRRLVDVIASRGDVIGAVRLVDYLASTREYQPTKMPLHAMLKHCKNTTSVDLAVWLVAYASEHWRVAPQDHITFEWLFQMAWNSRMFNLLRVVWVYITCAGQATFGMRQRIKQSLDDRLEAEDRSVALRWKSAAGCVACNVDPLLDDRSTADVIASDLSRFEKVVPKRPFVSMLIEAILLDKEWTEMGKLMRGTTWKRVNAIRVELQLANPRLRTTTLLKPTITPRSARRKNTVNRRGMQARKYRTSL